MAPVTFSGWGSLHPSPVPGHPPASGTCTRAGASFPSHLRPRQLLRVLSTRPVPAETPESHCLRPARGDRTASVTSSSPGAGAERVGRPHCHVTLMRKWGRPHMSPPHVQLANVPLHLLGFDKPRTCLNLAERALVCTPGPRPRLSPTHPAQAGLQGSGWMGSPGPPLLSSGPSSRDPGSPRPCSPLSVLPWPPEWSSWK